MMTFEVKRAIAKILFKAEERLIGKNAAAFFIISGIVADYFIEWGWWDAD